MSSFSGEIPLPPDPSSNGGTARVSQPFSQSHVMPGYPVNPVAGAAGSQAYPYDAQTMAYYQAYYAQMAAAGYSYPTTGYPVTPGVTPYYTVPAAPVTTASNTPSSLHPLLQHQATGTSNSTGSSSSTGQKNNQAVGKKQERLPEVEEEDDDPTVDRGQGTHNKKNILACHGNEKTMNLNSLLLTNIQQSQYFKTTLYGMKTVNELLDEIWYNVKHMEPWERGSRKTGGQTGMCASVRGVGAGGIVSTPFCILYKLFTLKPTRKQILNLMKSKDSPFIRATAFLYIRYTQPPDQLWNWFNKYLSDPEEFKPRAGFGHGSPDMTVGEMVRHLLTKLDWFSTLFPRIPVPIQKDIDNKLREYDEQNPSENKRKEPEVESEEKSNSKKNRDEADGHRHRSRHDRSRSRDRSDNRDGQDHRHKKHKSSRRDDEDDYGRSFRRSRDRSPDRRSRDYDRGSSHHRSGRRY